MVGDSSIHTPGDLERLIALRTGRRVRNLTVEMNPERIVLRGLAPSFHVKQLAQHGVRDLFPDIRLDNTIMVEREMDLPSVA